MRSKGDETLLNKWTKCKCKTCGNIFNIKTSSLKYGRGKYCTKSCQVRATAIAMQARRDQRRENNPNWRGGAEAARHRSNIKTWHLKQRNKDFVLAYLQCHPCVDCGISDTDVLQFDHVRGQKDACVSMLVQNHAAVQTIVKEIEKCDVRCANCHIKVTKQRLIYV